MFITKNELLAHGAEWIEPFSPNRTGIIGYDLTAQKFHAVKDGQNVTLEEVQLNPLESVFVAAEEVIAMPDDMIGVVYIRNSRLRQGLHIDSPIYQPGHHTRIYFRVTNLSNSVITLAKGDSVAAMSFSRLNEAVPELYHGAFADEFDFRGLGEYTEQYKNAIKETEDRLKSVKQIEHGIYSNVLMLMSIFVAVFSLINVNISIARSDTVIKTLLIFNLSTVGSVAALISFVHALMDRRKGNYWLFGIAIICMIAAVLLGR